MKRLIAVLLAFILVMTVCPVRAEDVILEEPEEMEDMESSDPEEPEEEPEEMEDMESSDPEEPEEEPEEEDDESDEEEKPEKNYEELVVLNPTPMDGKFFTTMWGNATTDIDVRSIVNSYYLTVWGYDTGIFRTNNVIVSGMTVADEENGDRVYQMVLYDDLYFSDGSKITAWDYAFSILFQASPIIQELGGVPLELRFLKGYEEYFSGEVNYLSGVRVISDQLIQFTVKGESLPYFFELFRLGFLPYPIREIAPGCKVYDDGLGVYIGNEDLTITEPVFTKELLEATVMDPESGYLSYPTVGSGPYVLTSWDGETATFRINPYFKGDEEGYVPTIPKLRFTLGVNEDMVEKLEADEVQLLNKVTRRDSIERGTELVFSGQGYNMTNYPRIGLTFFVFTPDRIALQELNVRKAFAYCLDKEPLVADYTGGYGLAMDGLIGLGQWMYSLVNGNTEYPVTPLPEKPTRADEEAYEAELLLWEELSLDELVHYTLNVEEAIRLLEENSWVLNEEGKAYDPTKDAFRCKEINGELVKLDLTCAYPVTNYSAESMKTYLIPHLQEAGIRLTLIPMDMKTLLKSYNDRDIMDIDIFYLGDDFNIEFDPQLFFLEGDPTAPEEDTLPWVHAQMYEYCHQMVTTEPHDVLGFMTKWIEMQKHLTELLPLIPVYSNIYFDFYTMDLQNYDILKYITWGDAIVASSYYDTSEFMPEEEEEEEELEDGEVIFDDF